MGNLIAANGQIIYGLYDEPVDCVNYLDYPLETTMGMRVPGFLKRYLAYSSTSPVSSDRRS